MSKTRTSYNHQASNYEKRWETYLDHTHREFLKRIEVNKGDRILDVSCGTGLLAKNLIERKLPFSELVLNDISEEMISIAKDRLEDQPNVRFTEYPAVRLDQLDQRFDLILCLNAFHHYENQDRVVQNFYDLLSAGGRACILDWNRIGLFRPVNRIIKRFTREHIDTRSDREMINMLTETGFTIKNCNIWAFRYWRFYFLEAVKE